EALIFDFDGLILDTEMPDFSAWRETYADYGLEFPLDRWALRVGTVASLFDPYAHLESSLGRALPRDEVLRRQRAPNLELVAREVPRPGVVEYLDDAYRMKLRVAVASSSTQAWVVGHLSRLGLADYFHSIRCRDDVAKVKPDPELYELTLETLGIAPSQALAFEDSHNGIKAAKAAGIFCVAVPNDLTRRLDLDSAGADLRIGSMGDMKLRDLLREAERTGA
ncbi:MAG TPA: HAD family hydrolase, partial [bacterium]|nr:HAD family hydrolase [bacterium]